MSNQKQHSARRAPGRFIHPRRSGPGQLRPAGVIMQDCLSDETNRPASGQPRRPGRASKFRQKPRASCSRPALDGTNEPPAVESPLAKFAQATIETFSQPVACLSLGQLHSNHHLSQIETFFGHNNDERRRGKGQHKGLVASRLNVQLDTNLKDVTGRPRKSEQRCALSSSQDQQGACYSNSRQNRVDTLAKKDELERANQVRQRAANDLLERILWADNMAPRQRPCVKHTLGEQVIACATAAATAMSLVGGTPATRDSLCEQEKTPCTAVTVLDELTGDQLSSSPGAQGKTNHFVFDYSLITIGAAGSSEVASQSPSPTDLADDVQHQQPSFKPSDAHRESSEQFRLFSSLNLSVEALKRMVERNLVATLIGLYILISLTIIIALALPYLGGRHNLALSFDELAPAWPSEVAKTKQHVEVAEQTLPLPLADPEKPAAAKSAGREDKGTQVETATNQTNHGDSKSMSEEQLVANQTNSDSGGEETLGIAYKNPQSASKAYHELWATTYNQECQQLRIPFCNKPSTFMTSHSNLGTASGQSKSALAAAVRSFGQLSSYDKTLLPNQFTQARQVQIERALQRYEPIVDIRCYALLPLFLCSILAPKCIPIVTPASSSVFKQPNLEPPRRTSEPLVRSLGGRKFRKTMLSPDMSKVEHPNLSRLVPPCRSLCKEAFRKCTFFFEVLSLKLLDPEECDLLPDSSDPNVCVGQAEYEALKESTNTQVCQEDKFRCSDGECIPQRWHCDGFADCTDKSDELKCSRCDSNFEFYCGQDVCIGKHQVCNGIRDCKDGRDERQCLRLSPQESQVTSGLRRLETWNATENAWSPICGDYWSVSPMSHQACQSLGFSSANETVLVFPTPNRSTEHVKLADANDHSNLRAGPTTSSNMMPDYYSSSVGVDVERSSRDQMIDDLVADVDVTHQSNGQSLSGPLASPPLLDDKPKIDKAQVDHYVPQVDQKSFDSRSGNPSAREYSTGASLSEIKFKSISSFLYHGSQFGCRGQLARPKSHVYLQCSNFQCGRSVTSYSSRLKLHHHHHHQLLKSVETSYSPSGKAHNQAAMSLRSLVMTDTQETNSTCAKNGLRMSSNETRQGPVIALGDDAETFADSLETLESDISDSKAYLDQWLQVDSDDETLPESQVSSRLVVGGFESMPGEFPYLAALHGGPDEVFFCGGVLISIDWLLTAAHCVGNRTQPDGWMVKVGVTRRIASPAFVKKLKVRKIIKHQDFNKGNLFNNDIALILLEDPVEFNQFLRPICLPTANLKLGPDNSKDCVVVGFGKPKFSQEANYLHVAHFVDVPIVRHSICSDWYADHNVSLTEGMLCAGYAEGKRDACQGDSGSGLFCRYSNTNQFFVAGVVSFGIKCATPKLPGVYTSVPMYVHWIRTTTRNYGFPIH